jgi:hypothetical protein
MRACYVAIVGLVVLLSACTTSKSAQFTTSTYNRITFDLPPGWRAVPVTFDSGGFTPDAYWTNQSTLAQCRPNPSEHGDTSCGPPIASVNPHGFLAVVTSLPVDDRTFRPNTVIAGRQASVVSTSCRPTLGCYAGGRRLLHVEIRTPGRPSADLLDTLDLRVYFGAGASGLYSKVNQVLKAAKPS